MQGTIVSAEHVSAGEPLNLKDFIASLEIPVVAGGVGDYRTAMHLMRTGAAGVIVGYGESSATTTDAVLGIGVPMATAIVDAAAARRDYLDETGGRYVHVIADGGIDTSGDLAKAIACGADAVMLGEQLTDAADAPGRRPVLDLGRRAPLAAALRGHRLRRPGRRGTWRRCCSGRRARRRDRSTCSAPCAGRWRRRATRTSRSSSASGSPCGTERGSLG